MLRQLAHWKSRSTIDDTLDVFPCHGVGGIWGTIMTGVFASGVGLAFGETKTFVAHLEGLAVVAAFVFIGTWILLKITDAIIPMRVTVQEELVGLDRSQHGEAIL